MADNLIENTSGILKRGYIFLEDGDWDKANEYFERVLDADPENSLAYIGKMMFELQLKSVEELLEYDESYKENGNYIKAVRFADDAYANTLKEYENENIYRKAQKSIKTEKYIEAIAQLDRITDYKDAQDLKNNCCESIYNTALDMLDKKLFDSALFYFNYISSFKNVDNYIELSLRGKEEMKKLREAFAVKSARKIMHCDRKLCYLINKDGTVSCLWRRSDFKITRLEQEVMTKLSQWHNVVSISGYAANRFAVVLKGDGSIISTYDNVNSEAYGKDFLAIAGSRFTLLALNKDGTVSKLRPDQKYWQCEVEDWKDIVMLSQSSTHTVGLKSDGTVISTYKIGEQLSKEYVELLNELWETSQKYDKEHLQSLLLKTMNKYEPSLLKKAAEDLKHYGMILLTGVKEKMPDDYNVSEWRDILSVKAGRIFTVGLKADGTLIASGDIAQEALHKISLWHDISDFAVDFDVIYAVTKSGKVLCTDEKIAESIKDWQNITEIAVSDDIILAFTNDGQVLCNDETLITPEILSNIAERIPADSFEKLMSIEAENTVVRDELKHIEDEKIEAERLLKEAEQRLKKQRAQEKRRKTIEEKQRQAEEKRKEEALKSWRRCEGLCQHCGGDFKGFFTRKCSKCGKVKDY